jgi:hypothetical protein
VRDTEDIRKEEGEHRQLEAESLVEAAREREDWRLWLTRDEHEHVSIEGLKKLLAASREAEESDAQLLREALEALEYIKEVADGPLVVEPALPRLSAIATRAHIAVTKLEERLLCE